jgi:hypothetical protein
MEVGPDRECTHTLLCPWPLLRPPPTTCWLSISFSFHASGNLKKPTGESCAPSLHLRNRYSTYPRSPLPNPHRPRPHLLHLSYSPGGDPQERIYRRQSAPVQYTMRTTSPRRRLSETTTPSVMSMGASGHRTGCSERNQKGDSKSSYILFHVFPISQSSDCLYAHTNHFDLDQDRNVYY